MLEEPLYKFWPFPTVSYFATSILRIPGAFLQPESLTLLSLLWPRLAAPRQLKPLSCQLSEILKRPGSPQASLSWVISQHGVMTSTASLWHEIQEFLIASFDVTQRRRKPDTKTIFSAFPFVNKSWTSLCSWKKSCHIKRIPNFCCCISEIMKVQG